VRQAQGEHALVVGCDGLIGRALVDHLSAMGVPVTETSRRRASCGSQRVLLDLAGDVADWQIPPATSLAFLCAGVTSLGECRARPAASRHVNVEQTVALAERLIARGAFVVFLSTNLVFDGKQAHRGPDEPVAPRTEYGRQKADAERRLLGLGDSVAIVRLSKVVDRTTPLLAGWIRALLDGREIRPFSDMVLSPVPLGFAVRVIGRVGQRRLAGILQVSAPEDVTYDRVARQAARRLGRPAALVRPVTVAASALALEDVPRHTTLDTTRLTAALGVEAPAADRVVDQVMVGWA
jgi:dTDP-4-dehydrorhamnose reductase